MDTPGIRKIKNNPSPGIIGWSGKMKKCNGIRMIPSGAIVSTGWGSRRGKGFMKEIIRDPNPGAAALSGGGQSCPVTLVIIYLEDIR